MIDCKAEVSGGVILQQQPWETGWQPVRGPAPHSERVGTKVLHEVTYHLWKNGYGDETIQKNEEYYQVSPGAFNTIPDEQSLGGVRGIGSLKNATHH